MKPKPCIEITFFGGMDTINFSEFVEMTIQDYDMALDIAKRMIKSNLPYIWNEDQKPEFYQEFYPYDLVELINQMESYERDYDSGQR